jgi:hypothetical protein
MHKPSIFVGKERRGIDRAPGIPHARENHMIHTDDLYVRVRLLTEPSLWSWEICDRRSGRVLVSSWEATWTAYPSRAEASDAGLEHLRRYLGRRVAGESMARPELHRLARAG